MKVLRADDVVPLADAQPTVTKPPAAVLDNNSAAIDPPESLDTGDDEPVTCPICLEEFDHAEGSQDGLMSLQCGHNLCRTCLANYLAYHIENEGEAFPTCHLAFCKRVTLNRILKDVLGVRVFSRLLRLQSERQARSVHGVPLFCSTESCTEARQPFLPLDLTDNEVAAESSTPVVSCAGCDVRVCVQCGKEAHEDEMCIMNSPTTPRNTDFVDRLYATYAVGCVGACPRCGIHIIREGGCPSITCRCGHTFNFQAFRCADEVNGPGASQPISVTC